MSLAPGTRLGPYEITAQIGVGGMGEVYRARDKKLQRDVAIKVLPEALAHDSERLARFEREARTLASLNHPNIAQIHGLEESDGTKALVMELVEGPTLADRIAQEPIPLDEALPIAKQMAEALEAAHEQGIIHRDLKPANVKVRPDGVVKVLDFGLAKALEPVSAGNPNATASPTITSPAMMTRVGVMLGTAAYMSPEQAKGRAADKRSDVWAFGCVLFEMVTGRRAFEGENISDTLAVVLRGEPDWPALPRELPSAIRLLVERCLVKDRRRRLADMSTALFVMNEAASLSSEANVATASIPRVGRLAAAGAGVVAGAALAAFIIAAIYRPAPGEPQRLSIVLPADQPLAFGWNPGSSLAISSDGTEVAYASFNPSAPIERRDQLRVRSLGSRAVRDLPNAFRPRQPFFSPDGRWLAFFTPDGTLRKVALAGGNPVTLVEKIDGGAWTFGVWLDDGTIVFGGPGTGGLQRVPADGGRPQQLTAVDAARQERAHVPRSFVSEAGALLFVTLLPSSFETRLDAVILSSGERRVIVGDAGGALLAGQHVLLQRDAVWLVAPFDRMKLALAGSAVPLLDSVRDGLFLAVSPKGTMAYVPSADEAARTIGRVGRDGAFDPLGPPPGRFLRPRVSPDGQRVAYELVAPPEIAVHVYDLGRGSTTKLTQSGSESQVVWRPDGKAVVVASTRQDGRAIVLKELSGRERVLLQTEPGVNLRPESWSPDGTVLAYTRQHGGGQHDIWLLTMDDKPTARALIDSPAMEHSPKFSPDGRWLAYVSNASGRSEVYVTGYPQGEPVPVSTAGAFDPVWSRDGRFVYFRSSSGNTPQLMSVPVTVDRSTLKLGQPTPTLNLRVPSPAGVIEEYAGGGNAGPAYDVFAEGDFVMVRGSDPQNVREIVVVQNWFEELKRLVPK